MSERRPTVTVVISTYNQPDWLEKVLWGFLTQSIQPDEIIVADDGSTMETAALIERARTELLLPIEHLWHEDRGFRKNVILNRAIASARGDYLIFTDGDCIPRRNFVETHLSLARPNRFLSGGCIRLPRVVAQAIEFDDVRTGRAFQVEWLRRQGVRNVRRVMRLRYSPWRARISDACTPTRATWNGHNSSTWKHLLLRVNGFDERMGYGGEDRELGERLIRAGVRPRQIRHRALCLHLDHDRGYVDQCRLVFNRMLRRHNKRKRVPTTIAGIHNRLPLTANGALPVSLVVMTKNEERSLARCLDSVSWAAEKLVVDCGSEDRTVQVAEGHGARVISSAWRGYGKQRNFAAMQATHDWILMLDADQWLTPELAAELEILLPDLVSSRAAAVLLPMTATYAGRELRYYRSMVRKPKPRFYHRRRARWTEPPIHERLDATGLIQRARHEVLNEVCTSAYDHQRRLLTYAELKVGDCPAPTRRQSSWVLPFIYPAVFAKKFLLQLALLDGARGFILAHNEAQYTVFKRIRLFERTRLQREFGSAKGAFPRALKRSLSSGGGSGLEQTRSSSDR
ncbi:MAG: glycosyltransferase [Candidatus Dadabacteria bacterium]|nr:MAG: glycosyltransferase [Candidatus Dadabacteria bacterium]